MAFTRLHHVGVMVRDLEEARHFFGDILGLGVDEERSPLTQGRHVAFDNVNILDMPLGDTEIEVNRPNDEASGSARFLQGRGGIAALHHICLYSDDILAAVARLTAAGLQQVLPPGVTGWSGRGPAFFHPRSCLGILLEIWPPDPHVAAPQHRGQGVFSRLHHVGVVARDLEEARHFFCDILGLAVDEARSPLPEGRPASDNVRILDIPIGASEIEISVPQDTVSGTARYLAQRGALGMTLHHICPYADDIDAAFARLKAAGLQPIREPAPAAPGRSRVGFFHPRSCLGILLEIWHDVPVA